MTKDEYEKFHVPDEYERKMKLVAIGIENAKKNNEKKKRIIESKQKWRKYNQYKEKYDL